MTSDIWAPHPFSVTLTIEHADPLTEEQLERLADLGGAVSAEVGDSRAVVAVNAEGLTPGIAVDEAARAVHEILPVCSVAAAEVLTVDELERRLAEPAFPELVGIGEIGEMLGVTRQRASALQTRQGFPSPVAVLRSGPVWRKGDLSRFADQWARTPGRPRKERQPTA